MRTLRLSGARTLARCPGGCTCGGACRGEDELEDRSRAQFGRAVLGRVVASDQDDRATEIARSEDGSVVPLGRGSRGDAVAAVQAQLSTTGVACGVDGVFGPRTEASVEFFQSAHRLVVDGIVGRETTAMLRREATLHGDADGLAARGGAPCHTPDDPGPDDQFTATQQPQAAEKPRVGGLALGFAVGGPDGGGGGGGSAPPPAQAPAPDLVVQVSAGDFEAFAPPGSKIVKVLSAQDLRDELAKRKVVGRLIVLGHAAEKTGAVQFDVGTNSTLTSLEDLADTLRGSAKVQGTIDLVACSTGQNPQGLSKLNSALQAAGTSGFTCHMDADRAGPLTADGVSITTEDQYQALSPAGKAAYDAGLRTRATGPGFHGECIVELKPGQTLAQIGKDELRGFAMNHKGVLTTWHAREDGTCGKDMKFGGSAKCRREQAK